VGGLADAVAGLAQEMGRRGHDVRVVLPLYGHLDRSVLGIRPLKKLPPMAVHAGGRMHEVRWHVQGSGRGAVRIYLAESTLFDTDGVYDSADGLERAALHALAALQLPMALEWPVDLIHAHDAQAAAALVLRRELWAGRGLPGPAATVLTIHNLAHQEIHDPAGAAVLGLPPSLAAYPGLLEFHGRLNLMKAGVLAADRLNTVSPNYARETTTDPQYGCGLESVLASRGDAYQGILNGGDYETWDPRADSMLPANYGPGDLAGKAVCRRELCAELGLEAAPDRPLCGFVGRLVGQKGVDLLLPLLDRLAADGFAFAILGTGEPDLEAAARAAAERNPGRVAFIGEFDEALAHRIYAGSDLFLMPSIFEPCGLSQMYALRYGTPPVVRATGGLADTVTDAADPAGTGFVFHQARSEELLAALRRAEAVLIDAPVRNALLARGMACDFGWSRAATDYENLYAGALAAANQRSDGVL